MSTIARVNNVLRILFSEDPMAKTGRNLTSWSERFFGLNFTQARHLVHVWKNLRSPIASTRRYWLARRAIAQGRTNVALDMSEGYAPFNISQIEGGAEITRLLHRLWEERCVGTIHPDFAWAKKDVMKQFLRNCFLKNDFVEYPELADFVLNEVFIQSAVQYFGAVPRLGSAQLWWSPANNEQVGSQLWHFDKEDQKQFKIFVNISDVLVEGNGPFTFLPAPISLAFRKEMESRGVRLSDEYVDNALGGKPPLKALGPAGTSLIVDTSRCLHLGSRTREGYRLVLMIQYIPHNVHREPTSLPPRIDASRYSADPIRHLIAAEAEAANSHA